MPVKDCKTEQLIIETAMRVFFAEGRYNATTQEIADAAGVNRTLIHYYFRSRDLLFSTVLEQAQKRYGERSDEILLSSLPFREKTEQFISEFMKKLKDYPFLELYITHDIIQQEMGKDSLIPRPDGGPSPILTYLQEIGEEMEKGTIPRTRPVHFLLNMFSLMIYPRLMKPLQKVLYNLSEEEFDRILMERKEVIMRQLFPAGY